jgi:hypothetical protein
VKRLGVLFLLLAASGCHRRGELEGPFNSSWGASLFVREGDDVAVAYPRGSMRCAVSGDDLRCGWVSGDARGKATLKREPTGVVRGTWGRGDSDVDGGPWVFVKER